MKETLKDTVVREDGYILLLVVVVLLVVTVIGIAATQTTITEMKIAGNEKFRINEFYNAEGGLVDTIERSDDWMTDDFLTASQTTAKYTTTWGPNKATVEIRCIQDPAAVVAGLSAAANKVPVQAHIGPPPVGSGSSAKSFEVRRYAVTATSTSGNSQLQIGIWKVFNKY